MLDLTGFGSIFDFGSKVIDKLFPDPEKANAAKLEMIKLQQSGEFKQIESALEMAKGQMEINKIEAASSNLFKSGWRPATGWTCVIGLFYQFILRPLAVGFNYGDFPPLELGTLITILGGLLGLGTLRTKEKIEGVA